MSAVQLKSGVGLRFLRKRRPDECRRLRSWVSALGSRLPMICITRRTDGVVAAGALERIERRDFGELIVFRDIGGYRESGNRVQELPKLEDYGVSCHGEGEFGELGWGVFQEALKRVADVAV